VITTKVRAKIDENRLKAKVVRASSKSLEGVGVMVQRSARAQFSNRFTKTKPTWTRVGEYQGKPVLSMDFRPPIAGKVTSWKNRRGRGATQTGFLRTLIAWSVDTRSNSVVIGPTDAATWLNKLQEFGGSARRVLKRVGVYENTPGGRDSRGRFRKNITTRNTLLQKFKPPAGMLGGGRSGGRDSRGRFRANVGQGAHVGVWVDPAHTRRSGVELASKPGKVKPGRFMKKGLDKKRDVLVKHFKNRIQGP